MRFIYLLSLLLFISCSERRSDDFVFYDSDQIDYYHLTVGEKELAEIFQNENMSRHQRLLAEILHHSAPNAVSDTAFIGEMNEMRYFKKTTLDKNAKRKIVRSFAPHDDLLSASFSGSIITCAPTYRDILVFRKQNKIIGFAKLCFDCDHTHLVGSSFEAVHTDYQNLKKALKRFVRK